MIWRCCSRLWMMWGDRCKRIWNLAYKQEWFAGIFLLTTLHVNMFKLICVLRTSSHFCCHDSVHEARSGVNGWGWQAMAGWRFKLQRRVDLTTCAEIYDACWIKHNLRLSVRAPRRARDGVCSTRFKQFINENVVDIHRRAPCSIRSLNSRNNSSIDVLLRALLWNGSGNGSFEGETDLFAIYIQFWHARHLL